MWGDGSCGYSVAEFDTFTRFKLPVMALVGNDAGWTQILREQVTILGTEVACKLAVRETLFYFVSNLKILGNVQIFCSFYISSTPIITSLLKDMEDPVTF